jgi:hypothetical protein
MSPLRRFVNDATSLKTKMYDKPLYTHYNPHNVYNQIKYGIAKDMVLYRYILLSLVTNIYQNNLCPALVK